MILNVNDISMFDWVIATILLLFLLRGLCIGFVRQLAATIALVGSWWVASEYAGLVMPYMENVIHRPGAVFFISFGGLFLLSALIFSLISQLLHKALEVNILGWANRMAGGLLGVARGALVIVLLYMLVAALLPASDPLFDRSLSVPYLNQGSGLIRQFIRDVSIRSDLKPKPAKKRKHEEKQMPLPKTALPATTEKVETAIIPDQAEPVQQEPAVLDQGPNNMEYEEPVIIPNQDEPVQMPEPEQRGHQDTTEPR